MTSPLSNSVRIIAELRERLKAEFALDDGDESLETTLQGESDLPEQIAILARHALRCEAMAEGMKALIKDNQDRKARLELRAEKLRKMITWAMDDSGMKKLPTPDMSLSIRPGTAPLVINDSIPVPREFCRVKYEIDKMLVRLTLEEGKELPFAKLGNASQVLTIRKT